MAFEVTIPEVGESITEGFLAEWSQPEGAVVAIEDPLLVLETDKITMNINAEQAGRLHILVAEGETVQVGQVVATIDTEVIAPADADEKPATTTTPEPTRAPEPSAPEAAPPDVAGLSPAVKRLVLEHQLNPAAIDGTGKGGRILKGDVIRHLDAGAAVAADPTPRPAEAKPVPAPAADGWSRSSRPPPSSPPSTRPT